jgi:hypothetical protein
VVPQVVHHAIKYLTAAAAASRTGTAATCNNNASRNLHENIVVSQKPNSSIKCVAKADIENLTDYNKSRERRLIFPSASGPVEKSFWATPLHGRVDYYHRLHQADGSQHHRMMQALVTEIMHEQKTLTYLAKRYGGSSADHHGQTGSPVFVEWFMGYPPNWTRV